VNTGKVLNPMTHDSERGWNHVDFMIDALLASGNSGSPVFAVSCRTASRSWWASTTPDIPMPRP